MRSVVGASLLFIVTVAQGAGVVKIQPILAAKSDGTGLVESLLFEDYTRKIWAQADIAFDFLPATTVSDDAYYNFDYTNADALVAAPGKGQSADALTINVFFTNTFTNYGSGTLYGFGYYNSPYMAVSVSAVKSFSDLGRVDTFAHEVGHVLNLRHYDDLYGVPGSASYLMTSGANRSVPQALTDVYPDGSGLSQLSPNEIAIANRSRFVQTVPEPASMLAMGAGAVALLRRRSGRR